MPETTFTRYRRLPRVVLIALVVIVLAVGSFNLALATTRSGAAFHGDGRGSADSLSMRSGDVLTGSQVQASQTLTVTKRDALVGDVDSDGQADPGDTDCPRYSC
jgi:hypothetical protein